MPTSNGMDLSMKHQYLPEDLQEVVKAKVKYDISKPTQPGRGAQTTLRKES